MAGKIHRTMIGGQAVIEGVMMRGPKKTALAVRKPDGAIEIEIMQTSAAHRHPLLKLPIIRGCVSFVEMLVYGYKTLMHSAEIAGIDLDDEKPQPKPDTNADTQQTAENEPEQQTEPQAQTADINTETETAVDAQAQADVAAIVGTNTETEAEADTAESQNAQPQTENSAADDTQPDKAAETETDKKDDSEDEGFSDKAMGAITVLSLVLGLAIAVLLFVVAPTFIIKKTTPFVHWGWTKTIAEGGIKIIIFVAYLALVSRMSDVKRVFEYHGAEHKTIACYEHGDELTPENAKKYTRFHPRCGTSFLLIVLVVSIIVFSLPFVTWNNILLRVVTKLLLLPVVVGISYEIIKFAGRHDNSFMRFILAPGLWLQRLTTREPDLEQLEVAIESIMPVLPEDPEEDKW